MFPFKDAILSFADEIKQIEAEKAQAFKDLEQTQKDLANALDKGKEVTLLLNQAVSERNTAQSQLLEANRALGASIARERELQARLAELTKPPVVTLPPTSSQKVTRAVLGRWAAFTIEHSKKSPSPTENAYARKAMDWGKSIGMDLYRIFLNPTETRAMATMAVDNPENIIGYGRTLGLRWMADTMDTIVGLLKTHTELKTHCDALIKMGCEGFYINDADRAALPFDALKGMIGRLRAASPDMPIFVSLLGSANLDLYKSVADYVEIQTFGTVAELTTFLKRGVIPCLDLRKSLTANDLELRIEVILRYPPQAFFFYADLVTDYQDAPDVEDALIKEFVKAWKAR